MFFLLLTRLAAAQTCSEPLHVHEIADAMADAERAYAALDEVGFRDRTNALTGILLPCVADPLPPDLVSRHHRLMAMQLAMVGDEPGSIAAIEASKAVHETESLPASLLPAAHPLRDAYEAFEASPSTRRVPEPRSGSITFDGTNTRSRPRHHPTVVQFFDGRGVSVQTRYLAPGDPLPPYRAIPRKRNALLATSIASFVLAGGTYAAALAQKGDLLSTASDLEISADQLRSKRDRANTLTITSGALLSFGGATAVVALAIGER